MEFTRVSSLRFSLNEVYWGIQLQSNEPKKALNNKEK
jgi:hypothetical protein